MTAAKRILLGLFITSLISCNKSTNHHGGSNQKEIANNYVSNISLIDGKIRIDTNAIINNNNLQLLIHELDRTNLNDKKTISEIPPYIKLFLDSLTDNFSIANPGEDWQVGCSRMGNLIQKKVYVKETGDTLIKISFDSNLPGRQLIYLGVGKDIALMTYYTGGIGKSVHIIIIKSKDNMIVDFWCGNTLTDLTNKAEILKYLTDNKDKPWGLNSSFIHI